MKTKSAIVIVMVLFAAQLCAQDTAAADAGEIKRLEEIKIRLAVEMQYIKGLQIRDFELIRKVCIPQAKLMGVNKKGNSI